MIRTETEPQSPYIEDENYLRLLTLKDNPITSKDGKLILHPTRALKWNILFYIKAFNDMSVTKHLSISPDFIPSSYIEDMKNSRDEALYHIYLNNQKGGPVGHLSIKEIDWKRLTFSIGLVIKKEFWGQEIGPKAGFLVIEHMKKLGFKKVSVEIQQGNTKSLKSVKKQPVQRIISKNKKVFFELDLTQPLTKNPFQSNTI